MIDFTTGQLSWIVVGACSLGGGGYLTMNASLTELDKKVEISNVKAQVTQEKIAVLQAQLDRIENKLDSKGSK